MAECPVSQPMPRCPLCGHLLPRLGSDIPPMKQSYCFYDLTQVSFPLVPGFPSIQMSSLSYLGHLSTWIPAHADTLNTWHQTAPLHGYSPHLNQASTTGNHT